MFDRDNLEIIEDDSKTPTRFYVTPSLLYFKQLIEGNYQQPYDTNWEFYSTFKMSPKDFIHYIEVERNAVVESVIGFPYMSFYFKNYCDASLFLSDFCNRKNNLFPENSN